MKKRPRWLLALRVVLLTLFALCGYLVVFTDAEPRGLLWALAALFTSSEAALSYWWSRKEEEVAEST